MMGAAGASWGGRGGGGGGGGDDAAVGHPVQCQTQSSPHTEKRHVLCIVSCSHSYCRCRAKVAAECSKSVLLSMC